MTADVEVLPCPFCGDSEHLYVEHLEGTIIHPAYRVRCDSCGASTGYTDKDCRASWNTRAATAAQAAEIEALRAEASTAHAAVHYHIAEHAKTIARADKMAEALREAKRLGDQGDWRAEREVICTALRKYGQGNNDA